MREAQVAVEAGLFKTVTLEINAKIQSVDHNQFISCLVTHMRQRLFTTAASNRSRVSTGDGNTYDQELCDNYNDLVEDLSILEPENWSSGPGDSVDVRFGEEQISRLCSRFSFDKRMCSNGFRDFVECAGRYEPEMLKPLLLCARSLPCSTAECERAFSSMNVLVSPARNSLLMKNISSLLFIKINGPPVDKFIPSRYVKQWLLMHASATDKQVRRPLENQEVKDIKDSIWSLL